MIKIHYHTEKYSYRLRQKEDSLLYRRKLSLKYKNLAGLAPLEGFDFSISAALSSACCAFLCLHYRCNFLPTTLFLPAVPLYFSAYCAFFSACLLELSHRYIKNESCAQIQCENRLPKLILCGYRLK